MTYFIECLIVSRAIITGCLPVLPPKTCFYDLRNPSSKQNKTLCKVGSPYRQCGLQQYTQNYGPHPESVTQVGWVMNQRMITI